MGECKYQALFEELKTAIVSGKYAHGQKLPSEAALVLRTGLSRITVTRALRELQLAGFVDRIAGSGSYARDPSVQQRRSYLFGLLIPDLGKTEIYAPLCRAIAGASGAREHALLWGNPGSGSPARQALRLVEQFQARPVDGVFFAPVGFGAETERTNHGVLRALRKAGIPTVLLDRRVTRMSNRNGTDQTGLNHQHAGYIAAEHLIQQGCTRLGFVIHDGQASSIGDREAGFRRAAADYGVRSLQITVLDISAGTTALRRWAMRHSGAGVLGLNDQVAGQIIHLAGTWGLDVPGDLRVVGVGDTGYAGAVAVPLTTVRQPLQQIGETAMDLMLKRIADPTRPTRAVLLDGQLIVRASSAGTATSQGTLHRKLESFARAPIAKARPVSAQQLART